MKIRGLEISRTKVYTNVPELDPDDIGKFRLNRDFKTQLDLNTAQISFDTNEKTELLRLSINWLNNESNTVTSTQSEIPAEQQVQDPEKLNIDTKILNYYDITIGLITLNNKYNLTFNTHVSYGRHTSSSIIRKKPSTRKEYIFEHTFYKLGGGLGYHQPVSFGNIFAESNLEITKYHGFLHRNTSFTTPTFSFSLGYSSFFK